MFKSVACMKKNDPCYVICRYLHTHKADSADWTTLRYRHNSLYLPTQSKKLVLEAVVEAVTLVS